MQTIDRVLAILEDVKSAGAERILETGAMPPLRELYGSSSGWRATISSGGVQRGHSRLYWMTARPDHAKPSRPMPTP